MDSGDCGDPFVGPVVDLVDPYVTKDEAAASAERVMRWLDEHPGRWAMFAEGPYGIDRKNIRNDRYEVVRRGTMRGVERAYARLPHPEGEGLDAALARRSAAIYPNDLPELEKDRFEWTKEELQKACEAARESLFPVRASRSGRGGRK